MKNTLKFAVAVLALTISAVSFNGCKKGEEDPGISFKSRKGRVAGDWTLTSMDYTSTMLNTYSSPDTSGIAKEEETITESFDGTNYTEQSMMKTTEVNGDYMLTNSAASGGSISNDYSMYSAGLLSKVTASGTYSNTMTYTVTFGKDGKYEAKVIQKRNTSINGASNIAYSLVTVETLDATTEMEGTWAFIGKDKSNEFKNKERIGIWYSKVTTMTVEEEKETYTDKLPGGVFANLSETNKADSKSTDDYKSSAPDEVWELVELKNKEIKFIRTGTMTSTGNTTNYNTSYSIIASAMITTSSASSYTMKNEWTMTGTMTAK